MSKKATLRQHRTGRGPKAVRTSKRDGFGKVRSKRDDKARVNFKADLRTGGWA
jgi:hypothetical protein